MIMDVPQGGLPLATGAPGNRPRYAGRVMTARTGDHAHRWTLDLGPGPMPRSSRCFHSAEVMGDQG